MTVNTVNQDIPANFAPLIGELVTLVRAYKKVAYGLDEWEIIAKTDGGVSFPVKCFKELHYAFELAGVDLAPTAQGSDWSAAPLYEATIAWDYRHNRLTFDKLQLPDNSVVTLDIEAWGKRRDNRTAPIIPELRKNAAPDKLAELEKLAISLVNCYPVEDSRPKAHAKMILRSVWAFRGKDTKAPIPTPHGISAISGKDKAVKIEALALEILADMGEMTDSNLALIVMDCMAIQGKQSPRKGKQKGRA